MELTVRGLHTNVIDTGAGDRGTVLFLNGWATAARRYQPIFELLSARGWRVVGFDMPGVGGTDEPKRPLTLEDYRDFTLDLCAQMGITEAVLFGHSHGGRLALLMLETPDLPLRCGKCVLMDAAGVRFPPNARQRVSRFFYQLVRRLGTWRLTAPLFGDLYAEWRDKRSSADYRAASPVMRETMKLVLPRDLRPEMGKITAETLLLWGEHDTATTLEAAHEMERLIPGAGLAVIRGAGHFPFEENWAQTRTVLEAFL